MAFDGPTDDGDTPDKPPAREIPQKRETPYDLDQPEFARAVGELASENADLYKQVCELTHALKVEKACFSTWARHVDRNREEAAQDRARMTERLDNVLAMNEALADRVTELERKLTDQVPATGVGAPGRRIDEQKTVTRQTDRKHQRRLKASTEIINVGTMSVSTVAADMLGSAVAAGIAGNALGLVAAVIAL